ncbi:MAG: hypothetical protein ACRERX_21815 [Pseudomonas sp.]
MNEIFFHSALRYGLQVSAITFSCAAESGGAAGEIALRVRIAAAAENETGIVLNPRARTPLDVGQRG